MFRLFDARMDIDLRCNYQCPFCWREHGNNSSNIMGYDTISSCLDSLKGVCWHIYLSCAGEPLLHPEFEKIMDYVGTNLQSTDTTIITNGFTLTEKSAHAICNAEITSVAISVHSLDSELFAKLAGIKSENGVLKVIQNINMLIGIRGNRPFPKIIINAVAMKSTLNGLDEIAKWICNSGIDGLRILWFQPADNAFSKEEYLPPSITTSEKLASLGRLLRMHDKFFDAPDLGNSGKIKAILRGLKWTKRPLEYLVHVYRKFTHTIFNKNCINYGLSLFVNQTGDISICPNGLNPLGSLIGMSQQDVTKQILSKTKTNDELSCKQCGIYASRQTQKVTT